MSDKELSIKANFNETYDQQLPQPYLKKMDDVGYVLPQNTKPLYLSLIKHLLSCGHKEISIVDVGSSYGINTLLLQYGLELADVNRLFLEDRKKLPHDVLVSKVRAVLSQTPSMKGLKFHLLDASKSAIEFSIACGLCADGFGENLEEDEPSHGLNDAFAEANLFISTGCIGYVGVKTFQKIFKAINGPHGRTQWPVFAFSCLRIFSLSDIKAVFQDNGYEILKRDAMPIIQRRFEDGVEREKALDTLSQKRIPAPYEEDGHYYADLYVAVHSKGESGMSEWLGKNKFKIL